MSHFSMLVVMDEQPTEESLAKVMAPWHEFECTGLDNEYVLDVDKTEEARKDYNSGTTPFVVLSTGERISRYDEQFYHNDPDDRGLLSSKKFVLPKGAQEIEVPTSEVESFEKYASEYYGVPVINEGNQEVIGGDETKYGYVLVKKDGTIQVVDRTNPNAKWDWYVIGGRWSGLLRSKVGGLKGEPGLMGSEYDAKGVDVCRRSDLDLEAMRLNRIKNREEVFTAALKRFREFDKYIPGTTVEDLKKFSAMYAMAISGARKAWESAGQKEAFHQFIENSEDNNSAMIRNIREKFGGIISWRIDLPEGTADADEWIQSAPALSAWGVIKDGQWYEKGSMGWFGISSDDKPEDQWEEELSKLVLNLPDDKWLVVVDCHI